jgi:hypothetical protein
MSRYNNSTLKDPLDNFWHSYIITAKPNCPGRDKTIGEQSLKQTQNVVKKVKISPCTIGNLSGTRERSKCIYENTSFQIKTFSWLRSS